MDNFIWKKSDQDKYYQIVCNNYIGNIFKFIHNKQYVFYLDYERNDLDVISKYYNGKDIDITDFEKTKKFKHYKSFPFHDKFKNIRDTDPTNIGFTITNYEDDSLSGCGQCGVSYGGSFWFEGLAYNTGLNGDKPIEYEGYIKTYNFFRCECETENYDEIICSDEDDVPFLEIVCTPIKNTYNLCLVNRCILFNIKYMKL